MRQYLFYCILECFSCKNSPKEFQMYQPVLLSSHIFSSSLSSRSARHLPSRLFPLIYGFVLSTLTFSVTVLLITWFPSNTYIEVKIETWRQFV